jgi:hypothetical protein
MSRLSSSRGLPVRKKGIRNENAILAAHADLGIKGERVSPTCPSPASGRGRGSHRRPWPSRARSCRFVLDKIVVIAYKGCDG